jgi:beta-glucosidase
MKKNKLAVLTSCLVLSGTFCTQAQNKTPQEIRIPDTYKLTNKSIYRNGWIDFNKNGKKDVYEDPTVPIDARVEDLLSQMNVEEKTCQMVTLYGYKRVLKDDLPTSDWKKQLWKDGIGAIDEHLNGFQQWGLPPSDNPYVWPASRHAWALNEVQRFFIEETRLGIPTDFTNDFSTEPKPTRPSEERRFTMVTTSTSRKKTKDVSAITNMEPVSPNHAGLSNNSTATCPAPPTTFASA